MTDQFQQELKSKLKEGIIPSQIKKMGKFAIPILTKLSLNNLKPQSKPSTKEKPSSTIINETKLTTNNN